MPAMITHFLLGRRMLPMTGLPVIKRQDAFLLGVQGPDIFYFFRAYPWLPGKKGLPVGNALHEVCPSALVDALYMVLEETPSKDRDVVHSYILGLLCHYAADRMIHPFVCYFQEQMMKEDPTFAKNSDPYHYRIESALDTLLLQHDRGEYVSAFSLTTVLPKKDGERDAALARFYHCLLTATVGEAYTEKQLVRLTEDMRQSMMFMTDCTELKGKAIRFFERVRKQGAGLSTLLRTKEIEWYDFANMNHRMWIKEESVVSKQDVFELCEDTVALAASLMNGFEAGISGKELTNDIDFTGCRWFKEELTDETHCEL